MADKMVPDENNITHNHYNRGILMQPGELTPREVVVDLLTDAFRASSITDDTPPVEKEKVEKKSIVSQPPLWTVSDSDSDEEGGDDEDEDEEGPEEDEGSKDKGKEVKGKKEEKQEEPDWFKREIQETDPDIRRLKEVMWPTLLKILKPINDYYTALAKAEDEGRSLEQYLVLKETPAELLEEFNKCIEKLPAEWDVVLLKKKQEALTNTKTMREKAEVEEEYRIRHEGWYAMAAKEREEETRGMNTGVENIPYDTAVWSEAQKEELYRYRPVFEFIHSPTDFHKIDNYYANICRGYRDRVAPLNQTARCPCFNNSIISENAVYRKTVISVAVGSNNWQLLNYLAELASKNEHMQWLIFRCMHRYETDGFIMQRGKTTKNLFFDLVMEYLPKNDQDDPMKTWNILENIHPYDNYMKRVNDFSQDCGPTSIVKTSENLKVTYQESALSILLSAGHHSEFMQKIQDDVVQPADLPQILTEIVCSGDTSLLIYDFLPWMLQNYADNERGYDHPAKTLLFPSRLGHGRFPDSFLHAAIRRGDLKMLKAGLHFMRMFYKRRGDIKHQKCQELEHRYAKAGAVPKHLVPLYEMWKTPELLFHDLRRTINADRLNVVEFAIVQRERELELLLYKFGMNERRSYKKLREYVELMDSSVSLSSKNLAKLIPLMELTDVQQVFVIYHELEYPSEQRQQDMDEALKLMLYPQDSSLDGPRLRKPMQLENMMKIVSALLLAGANLPPRESWSANLPTEVRKIMDYVYQAREIRYNSPNLEPATSIADDVDIIECSSRFYPVCLELDVATADQYVYEYFKH